MSMINPPNRMEVVTSVQRRRRWSASEKVRMVEETFAPGITVSLVARRQGEKRDELTETPHEWTGRHSSVRYTLEPVFDRKMVDVASGRTPVLLDWAPSNIYG